MAANGPNSFGIRDNHTRGKVAERNIKRMLAFYRVYRSLAFVPQPVAQSTDHKKVRQAVAQFSPDLVLTVPWGHHIMLMENIKDDAVRCWYMQSTIANGWSRKVLLMQIETTAHTRQGKAISNFSLRLPPPQSDLVQQALKDPYLFDFLTLAEPFHERELETGLIAHLEKFLLELGQGFAFVGRQYHVEIGEQDFYIDLLFYDLRLRCYIVIELKRGAFKPEYAGKMMNPYSHPSAPNIPRQEAVDAADAVERFLELARKY